MADKDTKNSSKGHHTLVLPIEEEDYARFMNDSAYARQIIDENFRVNPELYPSQIQEGYKLNGSTRTSVKQEVSLRQIRIGNDFYRLRPSFLLPYFRGKTDEVADGLFLLRFGVPFWAIAYVFGHDHMYWYRLYISLSENNIVSTTIKSEEALPKDVLADEKHARLMKKKIYVATTIGSDCILGAEVSPKADEKSLTEAYQVFKEESKSVSIDYQPETVNTDGWTATQNSWEKLFPTIIVIECFLHAFLKIRNSARKKYAELFKEIADKVWNVYKAENLVCFAQRIRRVGEFLEKLPDSPMKENLRKFVKKRNKWIVFYDYKESYRTSNALDRVMKSMTRHAYNSQMFHGDTIEVTSKNYRAFALLYNFTPYSPATVKKNPSLNSPAAKANGFVYHEKWLHNLLISASMCGFRQ